MFTSASRIYAGLAKGELLAPIKTVVDLMDISNFSDPLPLSAESASNAIDAIRTNRKFMPKDLKTK